MLKMLGGFIFSFFFWFTIFSIKIETEQDFLETLKGYVCQANTSLFIHLHRTIGDPFGLIESKSP